MYNYLQLLSEQEKSFLIERPFPSSYPPMLATLTDRRFFTLEWLYECKFDGERALGFCHNGNVKILSRNKKDIRTTYPDIVSAFKDQSCDNFIVDGEIVAFKENVSSFSYLQRRLGVKNISLEEASINPVYYYLFDILYIDKWDVRDLPLRTRKQLLSKVIGYNSLIRFSDYVTENSKVFYEDACRAGWEGVIAKRIESKYQSKRSLDWLKFKCVKGQELIIIGYTKPKRTREGFGALLLGYYDRDKLCYAGKVGTGFTKQSLLSLKQQMDKYLTLIPPISNINESIVYQDVTWLQPVLVGEIKFLEWIEEGKLRHPSFKGLRYDKEAKEIIKEIPHDA